LRLLTGRQVCGSRLYFDVPELHGERLQDLLRCKRHLQLARGPILPSYNSPVSRSGSQISIANLKPCTGVTNSSTITKSGSTFSTNNQNNVATSFQHPSSNSSSIDEGYIHWCVDEDATLTRLVDLDTKTICEDTLIKTLLDTYSNIRGWRNLWTLSVCVDAAFVKVSLTSYGPGRVLRAN